MAQKKFETVIQKSNEIKKDTILNTRIVLLKPSGDFEAKDNRYGTIYICTPKNGADDYQKLHDYMYSTNQIQIKVIEQDNYRWTKLLVDVL